MRCDIKYHWKLRSMKKHDPMLFEIYKELQGKTIKFIPDEPNHVQADKDRALMSMQLRERFADRVLSVKRVDGYYPVEVKGGSLVRFSSNPVIYINHS